MPTDNGEQHEQNAHHGHHADMRKEAATDRGDHERSIQTGRDDIHTPAVSRRSPTSVYRSDSDTLSPFSPIRRTAEEVDRRFDDLNLDEWASQFAVFRRDNRLVVRADVPGLGKDDVKVEVDGGVLEISFPAPRPEDRKAKRTPVK